MAMSMRSYERFEAGDGEIRLERLFRFANLTDSDPLAIVAGLGEAAEALIEIRAISFIAPDVANVRFHRINRRGAQVEESDWIATVAFSYAKAPMREADRLANPLGFQVSSYRADAEVAP